MGSIYEADYYTVSAVAEKGVEYLPKDEVKKIIEALEKEINEAAKNLEFEKASKLREQIKELKMEMVS